MTAGGTLLISGSNDFSGPSTIGQGTVKTGSATR